MHTAARWVLLASLALAEGFTISPSGGLFVGRSLQLSQNGGLAPGCFGKSTQRSVSLRPARRASGGLAMQTGEKSTGTLIIVGVLAFGFLFGELSMCVCVCKRECFARVLCKCHECVVWCLASS